MPLLSSEGAGISIHPPREGWDGFVDDVEHVLGVFQSTHPVRGGTN